MIGVLIGWPDADGRRKVFRRHDGVLIGFIRSAEGRYFAEAACRPGCLIGLPVEGTWPTRQKALDALLDAVPNWRSG